VNSGAPEELAVPAPLVAPEASKPKGLNRKTKIAYDYLCPGPLRGENFRFINNYYI